MKVADLDIQRLIGPAGSAERDKDADTNQKPEQITSPMHVRANPWFAPTPFQKDIVRPLADAHFVLFFVTFKVLPLSCRAMPVPFRRASTATIV